MTLVAKSDQSTGNAVCATYVLQSHELVFAFTAPYSRRAPRAPAGPPPAGPLPGYDQDAAYDFLNRHGLAVRAVGLLVDDAAAAYAAATAHGGVGVLPPTPLAECDEGANGAQDGKGGAGAVIAEVKLYGDVVLRFVSGGHAGPYLPGFAPTPGAPRRCFGLRRLDHAVGNTHDLVETASYVAHMTGFHEFAEFVADDVGTVDSGLNSMVLASNNEMVLLPINEPTFGTKRKSQIQVCVRSLGQLAQGAVAGGSFAWAADLLKRESARCSLPAPTQPSPPPSYKQNDTTQTYLEQNEGPGLQHLALKTNDIIGTLREMRARSDCGGFEFMPRPCDAYYRTLQSRIVSGHPI